MRVRIAALSAFAAAGIAGACGSFEASSEPPDASAPEATATTPAPVPEAAPPEPEASPPDAPPPAITPFASGQANVAAIAVDSRFVYWTIDATAGGVRACPLAGCGAQPIDLVTGVDATGLALTANDVLALASGNLLLVAKPDRDAAGAPLALAPAPSNPNGVVVASNGDAYYATIDAIRRCGTPGPSGCAGGTTSTFIQATAAALSAGDTASLWWTRADRVDGCTYAVNCPGAKSVAFETGVRGLATDSTTAYWTQGSGIHEAALATAVAGTPDAAAVDAIPAQSDATSLLVTNGALYWTSPSSGAIYRRPLSGGASTTTIAIGFAQPTVLASNGTDLFVACRGSSTIVRLKL